MKYICKNCQSDLPSNRIGERLCSEKGFEYCEATSEIWTAVQGSPGAPWYIHSISREERAPIARTIADEREHEDAEANARLIAAAPQMLAALTQARGMLKVLGDCKAALDVYPNTPHVRYSLELVISAIEKAGGKA